MSASILSFTAAVVITLLAGAAARVVSAIQCRAPGAIAEARRWHRADPWVLSPITRREVATVIGASDPMICWRSAALVARTRRGGQLCWRHAGHAVVLDGNVRCLGARGRSGES